MLPHLHTRVTAFLAFFLLAIPGFAAVFFVKPTASGTGDGSSWANAASDLQAIINGAAPGDEVWVAAGTYYPTRDGNGVQFPAAPRTRCFVLKNGVAVYGGFAGGEVALAARNIGANPTILSGDFDATPGNTADDAYHVVVSAFDGASTILDGFVIERGNANGGGSQSIEGAAVADNEGGGMNAQAGTPTIQNCIFRLNNSGTFGGGIATRSSPTVRRCFFLNNTTTGNHGGGFGSVASSPQVINCVFTGNHSTANGGGIYCNSAGNSPLVENCTLYGNTAGQSGGGFFNQSGTSTLRNTIIWGNTQGSNGQVFNEAGGITTAIHNLVQGGISGTGNVNSNPLFVNATDPDGIDNQYFTGDDGFMIGTCSPAANAGTGASAADILGTARVGTTDIGAYEHAGIVTLPGIPVLTGPATLCSGSLDALTVNISGGTPPYDITYTANGANTLTASMLLSGDGLSINPTVTTEYEVTAAVDALGCSAVISPGTVTHTVNVITLTATATATPATICSGANSQLDVLVGGATSYTYFWSPATFLSSTTIANPVATAATFGSTYTVTVTDTDHGCTTTANTTLSISSPTAAISGTATYCENVPAFVTFTASGGVAPHTFTYRINGGPDLFASPSSGTSVAVTAPTNVAGADVYELTAVTDGLGCTTPMSGTATITTVAAPPAPLVSPAGPVNSCQPINAMLTATATVTNYNLQWLKDGNPISGATAATYTATTTGTYAVNMLDTDIGCGSNSSTVQVLSSSLTASLTGSGTACVGGVSPSVTFTGFNGTPPYTFAYTVNGGSQQTTTSAGALADVAVPTAVAGAFAYALVSVTDDAGCTETAVGSATVSITDAPAPVPTATPAMVCAGSDVQLDAGAQAGGGPGAASGTFCSTYYGTGTGLGDYISRVNILGTTLDNATLGAPSPYFTLFPATGSSTATLTMGTSYTLSLSGGTFGTCYIRGWIDYNNDGTFDTGETIGVSPNVGNSMIGTFNFTVPTGLSTGQVRLRLRSSDTGPGPLPSHACNAVNSSYGETEDYILTLTNALTYTYAWTPATYLSDAAIANPVAVGVAATTTYTVTVTETSSGCAGNANVTVTVTPPIATIGGTTDVCMDGASPDITFTGADGTAPYTFAYSSDGGATTQTVTTTTGNSVTVSVPTGTPGILAYDLVSVTDATGCSQSQTGTATVTIHALPLEPTVTPSGSVYSCQPVNTVMTATPNNPNPAYQWTLDGGDISGATAATYTATALGTYAVRVTETTTGCVSAGSETYVITSPLDGSVSANVAGVCLNGVSPEITFEGIGGSDPYTFTYRVNGGADQTVTTSAGSTVTVSVPTGTTGRFTYALVSVQDGGGCLEYRQPYAAVDIQSPPSAPVTTPGSTCQGGSGAVLTASSASTGSAYAWWDAPTGGNMLSALQTPDAVTDLGASTASLQTFTYYAEASIDGCPSARTAATFTVGAVDGVITPVDIVCNGANNGSFTFAVGACGTAPFTYSVDGGAFGAIPTNLAVGAHTVQVQDAVAGLSAVYPFTIMESPAMSGTIAGTTTVCKDATEPGITFTATNGIAPYTFGYTVNGGAVQTLVSISANTAGMTAPTGASGVFDYALESIADGNGCMVSVAAQTATVTVNEISTIAPAGPSITTCQNGVASLPFEASGGTAPYAFGYTIDAGGPVSISSIAPSGTVQIPVNTTASGTFSYTLLDVRDAIGCQVMYNTVTSVTVQSGTLPTPTISPGSATAVCPPAITLLLTATPGTASPAYQWQKDGLDISGATAATYTATTAGTYRAVVTETSANCAAATDPVAVTFPSTPYTSAISATETMVCSGGNSQLELVVTPSTSFTYCEPYYSQYDGGAVRPGHSGNQPPAQGPVSAPAGASTLANRAAYQPAGGGYSVNYSSNGLEDFISLVSIAGTTLNNASGPTATPSYIEYPASGSTTATLTAGVTYTMTVAGGIYYDCYIRGWIDYDNDGQLESSETIGGTGNIGNYGTEDIIFTVPASAPNGPLRLRLRSSDDYTPDVSEACGTLETSDFGEGEDYTVTITGGQDPYPVSWSPATFLSAVTSYTPTATAVTATTTYTATVTDPASGCTISESIVLAVAGPRLYVNAAFTGGNHAGDCWCTAYTNLSDAIAFAKSCPVVDEVWVASGTYVPTRDALDNDAPADPRTKTFPLADGLALYGGFAGTEANLGDRVWPPASPSVLSGDLGSAGNTDNSYHVITATGVDATAVLNGFTIEAGNADGAGDDGKGGGVLANGAYPLVEQCTVTGNLATDGAGVAIVNPGTNAAQIAELKDCTITSNTATNSGGGIYAGQMMVKFTGTTTIITNNHAATVCE